MIRFPIHAPCFFGLMLALCFATAAFGQAHPHLLARFAHPEFDPATGHYHLDVELRTEQGTYALFGMNVRFFYDASLLKLVDFHDFHPGYGVLRDAPHAFVGNAESGVQMFGLERAAAYVNCGVQLFNEQALANLQPHQWTRLFRVRFRVMDGVPADAKICPSVIWDVKTPYGRGSFLRGSDGLVMTVLDDDPSSARETAPVEVVGLPFNWAYGAQGGDAMPFGHPFDDDCVVLSETVLSTGTAVGEKGYALLQNYPNPFAQHTAIAFSLPSPQEVVFRFFDVDGRVLHLRKGQYPAGRNMLLLEWADWMSGHEVLLYRMEAGDYLSSALKMTMFSR